MTLRFGTLMLLMLAGLLTNGLVEYNFGDTELLIVRQTFDDRTTVGFVAQRRRDFCEGPVIADVDFVQGQVINPDRTGDLDIALSCPAHHIHRVRG